MKRSLLPVCIQIWIFLFVLLCGSAHAQDTLTCGVNLINNDSLILDKKTNQPYTGFTRCIDGKTITYGFVENGKWEGEGKTFKLLKLKGPVPEGADSLYTWYEGQLYRLDGDGYINNGVVEKERFYIYYKNNSLNLASTTTMRGSGVDVSFFEDGSLQTVSEVKDGRNHGELKSYYEYSGHLRIKEYYTDGKLDGESIYYYESGGMQQRIIYENGDIVEGPYYYDEDGSGQ